MKKNSPELLDTPTTVPQLKSNTVELTLGQEKYIIPIDVYRLVQTLSLQNEEYKSAILKTKEYRLYSVDDAGNYGAQIPHQRNDLNSFSNFSGGAIPYDIALHIYHMELKLSRIALGFSNIPPAYSDYPKYEEVEYLLNQLSEDVELLKLSHIKY